jgi:AraC-like DNA-binding protein
VRPYREWPAHAALSQLVACTWVDPGRPRRPPVLPDACIDLVWDGARLRVVGPDTGPVPVLGRATYTGLRFKPGAAPGVLGVAASQLVDRTVALAELWGPAADELAERLWAEPARARQLLEQAILARPATAAPHPLVGELLARLSRRAAGGPVVGRLARELGVGERTLRRHCEEAIGYGPKMLERVLRGRRALRLIRSGVPLAEAAAWAGYADQAHLSHEVHRLAGRAPGQLRHLPELVISANGYA